MPDKRPFSRIPSLNILLSALVISLALVWLIKDPLVSTLTGYPLSSRRPLFQAGFIGSLTILLALLLIILGRKFLEWLIDHAYLPFFLLPVLPLAAHGYIGWFSRFVADDFSSATLAVNKGLLGATWDWYINWSGRFSASFFDSLLGYLGPSSLRWETGGTLLLLLIGLSILIWQFLHVRPVLFRLGAAVFLSASVLSTAFQITPDLPQSLYWGQGMRSLIFPLVPAAFQAAILVHFNHLPSGHSHIFWLAAIGLLSFVAGGFGETYVALQTTIYIIFMFITLLKEPSFVQKKNILSLSIGLFFSLVAMAVIVAAPGNSVRQTFFAPTPGLFTMLEIAANSTLTFFQRIFGSFSLVLPLLVLFISSLSISWLCASHQKLDETSISISSHPLFKDFPRSFCTLTVLSAIVLYASYVPAAYGMSSAPPDRTIILSTVIFCAYMTASGFLIGKHLASLYKSRFLPAPYLKMSIWILLFLYSIYTLQVTSGVLSVQNDYQRFASVFDRADRMIREAKAAGLSTVEVPEVHNHFGLSDYGAGTTYWLDQAVDGYYGIHVIVNKNRK